jgi:hypothetical protein
MNQFSSSVPSEVLRHTTASVDTLIVQTETSDLWDDAEVEVCLMIGLHQSKVFVHAVPCSCGLVAPVVGNRGRHLPLMRTGELRSDASREWYLDAMAIVALVEAGCGLIVGGQCLEVGAVLQVELVVAKVVDGNVG